MADDNDQGKKKTQRLTTLEEIQTKYYLEGPEAAQTHHYFELTERPSTSRVELERPHKSQKSQASQEFQDDFTQNEDVEAGTISPSVKETSSKSIWSGMDIALNECAVHYPMFRPSFPDLSYSMMTPHQTEMMLNIERKQFIYAKILKHIMEGGDPYRDCYLDSDQDDDDFYLQPDDYPETDWHHYFITFYKKHKHFLLFLKVLLQVLMFLGMFAAVVYVQAPLDIELETEKAEDVLKENPVFFD